MSNPLADAAPPSRLTLFFAGYEPLKPDVHHNRYVREIKRFDTTWNAVTTVSPLVMSQDETYGEWYAAVKGINWQSDAAIHLMRWDDVIEVDNARPLPLRLAFYLRAFASFLLNGAIFRYGWAHWRYLCFALYPIAMLTLFVALAYGAVALLPAPAWGQTLLGVAIFALLLRYIGRNWHMDYMFNDWAFAQDMVHQSRPLMESRIDSFARHIICEAAKPHSELVLIGHSLGAAMMVSAMARALEIEPDFLDKAPPVTMVALGSSLLKIALHNDAEWLRGAVVRVAAEEKLVWVEYDSHLDWISFYKADLGRWVGHVLKYPPERRSLRISRMLRPETWAMFKLNFLRLHRQYVMGNEERYPYDFHMLTAGPLAAREVVAHEATWPQRFDETGRLH